MQNPAVSFAPLSSKTYTCTVCVTVDASMVLALNLKGFFFPFFFFAKNAAASAMVVVIR